MDSLTKCSPKSSELNARNLTEITYFKEPVIAFFFKSTAEVYETKKKQKKTLKFKWSSVKTERTKKDKYCRKQENKSGTEVL